MQLFLESLPFLLRGLLVTFQLTLGGLFLGFVLGLLLAVARLYGGRFLVLLATAYSRVVRSIPLIALLLMLYLIVQEIADFSPMAAAIAGLSVHSASYQAEILRGAIGSVEEGQVKAGRSLGMSNFQVFRYIILPQALRNAIAPYSNEAAIVLKDSSLAFAIGATEMLRQASYIAARTLEPLAMYALAGAIYFLVTFSTNRLFDNLENRFSIAGTRGMNTK